MKRQIEKIPFVVDEFMAEVEKYTVKVGKDRGFLLNWLYSPLGGEKRNWWVSTLGKEEITSNMYQRYVYLLGSFKEYYSGLEGVDEEHHKLLKYYREEDREEKEVKEVKAEYYDNKLQGSYFQLSNGLKLRKGYNYLEDGGDYFLTHVDESKLTLQDLNLIKKEYGLEYVYDGWVIKISNLTDKFNKFNKKSKKQEHLVMDDNLEKAVNVFEEEKLDELEIQRQVLEKAKEVGIGKVHNDSVRIGVSARPIQDSKIREFVAEELGKVEEPRKREREKVEYAVEEDYFSEEVVEDKLQREKGRPKNEDITERVEVLEKEPVKVEKVDESKKIDKLVDSLYDTYSKRELNKGEMTFNEINTARAEWCAKFVDWVESLPIKDKGKVAKDNYWGIGTELVHKFFKGAKVLPPNNIPTAKDIKLLYYGLLSYFQALPIELDSAFTLNMYESIGVDTGVDMWYTPSLVEGFNILDYVSEYPIYLKDEGKPDYIVPNSAYTLGFGDKTGLVFYRKEDGVDLARLITYDTVVGYDSVCKCSTKYRGFNYNVEFTGKYILDGKEHKFSKVELDILDKEYGIGKTRGGVFAEFPVLAYLQLFTDSCWYGAGRILYKPSRKDELILTSREVDSYIASRDGLQIKYKTGDEVFYKAETIWCYDIVVAQLNQMVGVDVCKGKCDSKVYDNYLELKNIYSKDELVGKFGINYLAKHSGTKYLPSLTGLYKFKPVRESWKTLRRNNF